MNIKMPTNSQLSTTELNKQTKNKGNNQNRNRIINMEIIWWVINWEGQEGEWGKRCRD